MQILQPISKLGKLLNLYFYWFHTNLAEHAYIKKNILVILEPPENRLFVSIRFILLLF